MKKIMTILCTLLMCSTAFSASRIDEVVIEDAYERLQNIVVLKENLKKKDTALVVLETELNIQMEKVKKHQSGKVQTAVMGAIDVATYVTLRHFYKQGDESFASILGFLALPVLVGMTGEGVYNYYMNPKDAAECAEKVRSARTEIQKMQDNLKKEISQLCSIDARNKLCY